MTSIYEKRVSAKVRLTHAEQISLYNFIVFRKNERQLKTKQVKQDILNQCGSMGFPKLKVIDREKRSKTLSEVKPVENISKNLQSFLEISPVQKEVLPSHKLRDHACE